MYCGYRYVGESMSRPFWVLNLTLVLFLIGSLFFSFYARIKIPAFRPTTQQYETKAHEEPFDASLIYKKDLFQTASMQRQQRPEEKEIVAKRLPTPPVRIPTRIPQTQPFRFLEPLPLSLTGIIYFDDPTKDRAIIMDHRKKQEALYKLEDELEDAQIITIMADKVILLRSNGQQEILYLHQEKRMASKNWSSVVDALSPVHYQINREAFIKEIPDLTTFIFKFNIKAAIENGRSVGVRIGGLENNSLAQAMGLRSGDIITQINGISPLSTKERKEIYDLIVQNPQTVHVVVKRDGVTKPIAYEIKEYLDKDTKSRYNHSEIKKSYAHEPSHAIKKPQAYTNVLEEAKARDKNNIFKLKKK